MRPACLSAPNRRLALPGHPALGGSDVLNGKGLGDSTLSTKLPSLPCRSQEGAGKTGWVLGPSCIYLIFIHFYLAPGKGTRILGKLTHYTPILAMKSRVLVTNISGVCGCMFDVCVHMLVEV